MSLKIKTMSGIFWSFFGNFSNQIMTFVIGVILARLLTPDQYGLIGITTIFIVLFQTFVDSGFGQALIRKQHCSQNDYSTIFYFNLITGLVLYIFLFLLSNTISDFFHQPELTNIIRVLGLDLIINSLSLIHKIILTKQINFKVQAKISFIAIILSGLVGVILAYNDFGVWSLVVKSLLGSLISTILFWNFSKWRPSIMFCLVSFKELFGFGGKLLISSLIDRIYWNIYNIVIGKFFSARELGFYSRAEMFKNLPSQNITFVISRVVYPVMSKIGDKNDALKEKFRVIVKSTMYITLCTIIFMIVTGREIILILLGQKWIQSSNYLKLLCLAALFFPLIVLNNTIVQIKGKSAWYLKTQIITKFFSIPIILFGINYGIEILIIGTIIQQFVEFIFTSSWVNRLISYNLKNELLDVLPSFIITTIAGFFVYIFTLFTPFSIYITFLIQFILFFSTVICLSIFFKLEVFFLFKDLIREYLGNRKNIKK